MNDKPANPPSTDDEFAWFREGSVPHSREDRVAEALALIALIFSLGIGLVIALLPVSAKAATVADTSPAPTLVPSAFEVVPARPGKPEHLVDAAQARAGDQLEFQRDGAVTSGAAPARARATIACDSDA